MSATASMPQRLMAWAACSGCIRSRGNCATIGLPCVTMTREDSQAARAVAVADPSDIAVVDLVAKQLRIGSKTWPVDLNESLRRRFLTGTWGTHTTLLAGADDVRLARQRDVIVPGPAGTLARSAPVMALMSLSFWLAPA